MPKGQGRPKSQEFMKIGKVKVNRLDALNWTVETGEKQHFYSELPTAIRKAVEAAADARSTNAQDWLREYRLITGSLEKTLEKALKSWGREDAA